MLIIQKKDGLLWHSNKIDALQEIAIKQVMNEDCPVYERDVTIEEIKKTFKAYKDLLELRYLEDQ